MAEKGSERQTEGSDANKRTRNIQRAGNTQEQRKWKLRTKSTKCGKQKDFPALQTDWRTACRSVVWLPSCMPSTTRPISPKCRMPSLPLLPTPCPSGQRRKENTLQAVREGERPRIGQSAREEWEGGQESYIRLQPTAIDPLRPRPQPQSIVRFGVAAVSQRWCPASRPPLVVVKEEEEEEEVRTVMVGSGRLHIHHTRSLSTGKPTSGVGWLPTYLPTLVAYLSAYLHNLPTLQSLIVLFWPDLRAR
ncbi:hypothetical protein VTK73DRAFT_3589 [Phialemonium thermophilum]|uniref:Uncharacterized protein n=1 Tax=Phialemonium thermophilum TaxID=223376 RepID=A0ABR3VGW2_9PEZI